MGRAVCSAHFEHDHPLLPCLEPAVMKHIKKILGLSCLSVGIVLLGGLIIQSSGLLAEAATTTVNVSLEVQSEISISADSSNVTMSQALNVTGANEAVGTTTFTVINTDNNGYTLGLSASTRPAMTSGGLSIPDYSTTTNPSSWSVASGDARFGFSATGTDVSSSIWGSGTFCNASTGVATSTVSSSLKYYGFYTTATTVATRASSTTPGGDNTIVCYAVQQNNFFVTPATYQAVITGTATAL
jgi:hypothetical protein